MSQRVSRSSSIQSTFTWIAIGLGAVVFGVLYFMTSWNLLPVWIATWSLVTFLLYGYDKLQAKRNGIRAPEIVLHGLALAGGFPGGWLGMFVFNHKIRKRPFWLILTVATAAWIVLVILVLT